MEIFVLMFLALAMSMVAPCSLKILSMITIPRLFPSFLVEKYG
jgi:hypothetical protein